MSEEKDYAVLALDEELIENDYQVARMRALVSEVIVGELEADADFQLKMLGAFMDFCVHLRYVGERMLTLVSAEKRLPEET